MNKKEISKIEKESAEEILKYMKDNAALKACVMTYFTKNSTQIPIHLELKTAHFDITDTQDAQNIERIKDIQNKENFYGWTHQQHIQDALKSIN